jgi:hypothetical protein
VTWAHSETCESVSMSLRRKPMFSIFSRRCTNKLSYNIGMGTAGMGMLNMMVQEMNSVFFHTNNCGLCRNRSLARTTANVRTL